MFKRLEKKEEAQGGFRQRGRLGEGENNYVKKGGREEKGRREGGGRTGMAWIKKQGKLKTMPWERQFPLGMYPITGRAQSTARQYSTSGEAPTNREPLDIGSRVGVMDKTCPPLQLNIPDLVGPDLT